jgi:hypothetical protein
VSVVLGCGILRDQIDAVFDPDGSFVPLERL